MNIMNVLTVEELPTSWGRVEEWVLVEHFLDILLQKKADAEIIYSTTMNCLKENSTQLSWNSESRILLMHTTFTVTIEFPSANSLAFTSCGESSLDT